MRDVFSWPDSRYRTQGGNRVRVASTGFNPVGRGVSGMRTATGHTSSQYNVVSERLEEGSLIEDWIPRDPLRLNKLNKLIYLRDQVAGSTVDLYKELPWSDFNLTGVDEKARQLYEDGIVNIDIPLMMADLCGEFLVQGKGIGTVNWDSTAGRWIDILFHDPDFCTITPVPIRDAPPKINLKPSPGWRAFSTSKDPRDVGLRSSVDPELLLQMRKGNEIPLALDNTIYFARRAAPYDNIGTTIFTRIYPITGIENSLWSATMAGAKRKAAGTLHITTGVDGTWEPNNEEMDSIAGMFIQAEEDPIGSVVVTRTGVDASRMDSNQSMWSIGSEWSFFKEAKMTALGVNEALLSGDVSLQTKEVALSIFLDRVQALRDYATKQVLVKRIYTPIAKAHEIYKTPAKQVEHRYRTTDRPLDLPDTQWQKQLGPSADEEALSVLETLKDNEVPVPIRIMAATGGYDLDKAMSMLDEDVVLRERIKEWKKKTGQDDEEAFGSFDNFSPIKLQSSTAPIQGLPVKKVGSLPHWGLEGRFMGLTVSDVEKAIDDLKRLKTAALSDTNYMHRYLLQSCSGSEDRMAAMSYLLTRMNVIPPMAIASHALHPIVDWLTVTLDSKPELSKELWLISRWYLADPPDEVQFPVQGRDLFPVRLKKNELLTGCRS